MKGSNMENGVDKEEFERYTPKNPLPNEIQKMKRDETICKYCGVSYLIHNEIKALEEKLKKTEAELEKLKGCEEREGELKERIEKLEEEKSDLKRNLEAKEILITTLKNNIKNDEELKAANRQLQVKLEAAVKHKEEYRQKHSLYDRSLPLVKTKIAEQREEINSIHAFVEERNTQMKQELELLLSTVRDRCSSQDSDKKELLEKIESLESEKSETSVMMVALKEKLKAKEGEVVKLQQSVSDSVQLQHKITQLECSLNALQTELDENLSKNRSLQMETQQFKEQLRNKTKEVEDLTSQFRQRDQNNEMYTKKLHNDLRQKEAELQSRIKELKNVENKLQEQQAKEEEFHRKATLTVTASREIKQDLEKAREEIEQLKSEREIMITSHQNRIEQLRESFRQKISESEGWPEKLQEAIRKEREKHAKAIKKMEDVLKENFVMEMNIEKQKYQELLEKYQGSNKDHETMLRQQLNSLENKYRSEIKELQQILADSKIRAKETEDSLRKEVSSLKAIIKDLEDRLARLDSGNEEMIQKLKDQLKETHEELDQSKQELQSKEEQVQAVRQEVIFLQDTVRKECEERFELTEKLSEAKEELLQLKKPSGGYSSLASRHSAKSNASLSSSASAGTLSSLQSKDAERKSPQEQENGQILSPSPPRAPPREYAVSSGSNVSYQGEPAKPSGKLKGNSLESTRKRIAAMLGRKS